MSDIEFSVLEAQQDIHEMIAQQKPLEQTLEAIANWVGNMMPGALVSIMRFDPDTNSLSPVPNNRFSDDFFRAMQNIPVSGSIGTCGTAALTKCMVITEDIQKDPRWDGYRDIAEAEGLAACWSVPVLTSKRELLGTFCHFYRAPATPTAEARRHLAQSAALVAMCLGLDGFKPINRELGHLRGRPDTGDHCPAPERAG
jgi:GAF domain-containing protein